MSDNTVLPKVYVFINGGEAGWLYGAALAEDGAYLGGHISSNTDFVRIDMGIHADRDWSHKREKYAAHYPNGYEIVDLVRDDPRDPLTDDAGFVAAIARASTRDAASATTA